METAPGYLEQQYVAAILEFVYEIFRPAAEKLSAEEQQLFRQTRVLNATEPDEDGNYPYIFLMDPLISGGNYAIEPYLAKMYGKEKAQEHMQLFNDALAGEQEKYVLVQSGY